jgi:hypothetical protein
VDDAFEMMMAVALLGHSLNPRKNEAHVQFNTIRKTRSTISSIERTSASDLDHASLAGYTHGERMSFTNTSVYSFWFDRFVDGCHIRMVDDIRPDQGMYIELLLEIQKELENGMGSCPSVESMIACVPSRNILDLRLLCRTNERVINAHSESGYHVEVLFDGSAQ